MFDRTCRATSMISKRYGRALSGNIHGTVDYVRKNSAQTGRVL